MARGRKPGSKSTINIWKGDVGGQKLEINADARCYHLITPTVTRYFPTAKQLMTALAVDSVRRKALGKPTLRTIDELEKKFLLIAEDIGRSFDSKINDIVKLKGEDA